MEPTSLFRGYFCGRSRWGFDSFRVRGPQGCFAVEAFFLPNTLSSSRAIILLCAGRTHFFVCPIASRRTPKTRWSLSVLCVLMTRMAPSAQVMVETACSVQA